MERKKSFGPTLLGDGKPIVAPTEGRKKLTVGNPARWKNALVGTNVARDSMEDPKIAHSANEPMISLPDTLVDSVTFGLKLCVVSRFVAFRPTIEMV